MGILNMGGRVEKGGEKNLPDDFEAVFNRFKELVDSSEYPESFREIQEILDMAHGLDGNGARDEYFPKWEDAHFQELIKRLKVFE